MIYLDYNATTPILPTVLEEMLPYFTEHWGNASSPYSFSNPVAKAISTSREKVANLIGAQPKEIFFTSSATESNQTILNMYGPSVIASSTEHSSTHEMIQKLGGGHIPVNTQGIIDLTSLAEQIASKRPKLVSVIWANNETGVISPVTDVADICANNGVFFHTDAVQAAGKVAIDVKKIGVDYLTLSAHKIFGPKGIGVLYVKEGAPFESLIMGPQELKRRGGTESVPLIVGFGKAAELAHNDLAIRSCKSKSMRDKLEEAIFDCIDGVYLNGNKDDRLPNTLNVGIPDVDSDMLVQLLSSQGIMVSSGSACKSQAITPSHVLLAMGRSHKEANEGIRFSVSHLTTENEINTLISSLKLILQSL